MFTSHVIVKLAWDFFCQSAYSAYICCEIILRSNVCLTNQSNFFSFNGNPNSMTKLTQFFAAALTLGTLFVCAIGFGQEPPKPEPDPATNPPVSQSKPVLPSSPVVPSAIAAENEIAPATDPIPGGVELNSANIIPASPSNNVPSANSKSTTNAVPTPNSPSRVTQAGFNQPTSRQNTRPVTNQRGPRQSGFSRINAPRFSPVPSFIPRRRVRIGQVFRRFGRR